MTSLHAQEPARPGPAGPPPAQPPRRAIGPRTIALIVASAMFMEQLDTTVLSTALPAMARSFGTDSVTLNVALTAYLLSLAVFIPASGQIADRFGSRLVFRAAIAVFTIGSALCGLSTGVVFLVLARILQGIGGAMMVPVGRLVLLRSVAKRDRISAISWLLVPAMIGPVVGPPLGGFIVTYASWPWIFAINIPIGILGIVLVSLFIEDVREEAPGPFDFKGLVISGIALSSLMIGLELMTQRIVSPLSIILMLVIGFLAGALYWRHARHHPHPVLNLALMRIHTFRVAVIGGTLFRLGFGALPFVLPLMLQLGFGFSAARSGLVTFASAASTMVTKGVTVYVLRRFGYRSVLMWNGLLCTAFLALCGAFRPYWPLASLYAVLLIGGAFRSLQYNAYGTIAYADIPDDRMSDATSFYSVIQQFSTTLGIALAAIVLVISLTLGGHAEPLLGDFTTGFTALAAVSLIPFFICRLLPNDAGAEMTGHRPSLR